MYEHNIDRDLDPKPEGDPMIIFHEFLIIIARIAVDVFPKESMDKKTGYEIPLIAFFNDHLHLRTDQ
jgi:hypothetical protein